ncbi:ABC transporter ATP-binding protein [Corynebacterium sp. CCUG 18816]|uniref:ABC transporter ATP-binding protein n=1 Tax=Corynebacterium pseudogenitalium TaxID=38303 RepID=UPI00210CC2AA|nr:ABC transporter ATP-binding protein [Corynebacterium pseudogenitalium]MCQ4616061.1 ABC transporter ATP-binding protein [Corynebacterium pseudogenitalium]
MSGLRKTATEEIDEASIIVDGVSKRYVISQSRSDDANTVRTGRGKMVVDALKDVSFVVRPSESIGLIGLNGSGKSTLLKLMAGGENPTSGQILVRSQPMLMGVNAALQPNLPGEANIYLGCLALGMSPEEAREQIPLLAEWTELGDAVKRPMSTYSAGMKARLVFAISTAVKPEILLIDETLSTGDAAFGGKARARMNEVIDRAGNLFFVSHSIDQVQENCARVLWINNGELIADGPSKELCGYYSEWARLVGQSGSDAADEYLTKIPKQYLPASVFVC